MYIDLSFKTLFFIWVIFMLLRTPIEYLPFVLIIGAIMAIIGIFLYILSLFTVYVVVNPQVISQFVDKLPNEVLIIFSIIFIGSIIYFSYKGFDKKAFIKIMQEELSMPTFKKIFSIFKKRK